MYVDLAVVLLIMKDTDEEPVKSTFRLLHSNIFCLFSLSRFLVRRNKTDLPEVVLCKILSHQISFQCSPKSRSER